MAMTAFEIFGLLRLDRSDFDSGLTQAKNNIISAIGGGLTSAVKVGVAAIGAATTAVVGLGATSVKTGASFDKSISQVAATLGLTVAEMEEHIETVELAWGTFSGNLREYAQEMGAKTAFSATQAAEALNYMALAGYDAQTSMNMLPNVLNLAAAGNIDLALASDMVTDTQTAFGLTLERTGQLVDEMAKAASTGNTSVEQLGNAFLVVGGLAKELKGGFVTLADGTQAPVDGIQELEIALTAMANAGVKSGEAGTHIRNMLLKLSSPTAEGVKQMKTLGVSVFDTSGQMRSFKNIMGDLDEALGTLTQEDKILAISELFNTRDMAAAEALLGAVGQDWDKIGESILNASGAAQKMANTQLYNLSGDVTLFQSAFEGLQIAVSDKLNPALREFVQLGTSGISALTVALGTFDATPYIDEMGRMSQEGIQAQAEFEDNRKKAVDSLFGTISDGIGLIANKIPLAVEVGMKLLSALGEGILNNLPLIIEAGIEIIVKLSQGLIQALPQLVQGALTIVKSLSDSLKNNAETLSEIGIELLTMFWNGITTGLPILVEGAVTLMTKFATYLTDALPQIIPAAMNTLMEFSSSLRKNAGLLVDAGLNMILTLANSLIANIPEFIKTIPTIVIHIAGIINDNAPKLIVAGVELILNLIQGIINSVPTLIAEFPKIIQAIIAVWSAVNWLQLGTQLITKIGSGITSLASKIPTMIQDIGTQAFNFFRSIDWLHLGTNLITLIGNGIRSLITLIPSLLSTIGTTAVNLFKSINWVDLGLHLVQGIWNGMNGAYDWIKNKIAGWVGNVLDFIKGLFGISSPSKVMRDEVGKYIAQGMAVGIEKNIDSVEEASKDLSNIVVSTASVDFKNNKNNDTMGLTNRNVVINVYGADGQDVKELAEQIVNLLNSDINREQRVWNYV